MRRIILLAALMAPLPLLAQAQKKVPDGVTCVAISGIKSDAVITRLFSDADGDWWAVIRYASTGQLQIGLLMRNGQFCVAGEGRTNRES